MVGAFIRNAPFGTEIAFAKGLEALGHKVTKIDSSFPNQRWDLDADATVVFKWMEGYWEQLALCSGVKIVYQPDDARFPHIEKMLVDMKKYVDHVLTFDKYGVDLALSIGYKSAEFMLLTADHYLYAPDPSVEKDIDVSFVGSLTNGANHASRIKMLNIIQNASRSYGWKTWFGETYFGRSPSPVDVYRRSKIVVNHATDVGQPFGYGYGLQCRHFEVGMSGIPILSNTVYDFDNSLYFDKFYDEESLIYQINKFVVNKNHSVESGQRLREQIIKSHLPVHRAHQLVDFVEKNKC